MHRPGKPGKFRELANASRNQGKPGKIKGFCLSAIILILFRQLIGVGHALTCFVDYFVIFGLIDVFLFS